jgi:hypothetical protein
MRAARRRVPLQRVAEENAAAERGEAYIAKQPSVLSSLAARPREEGQCAIGKQSILGQSP